MSIPEGMWAIVASTVLALSALSFVLWPLIFGTAAEPAFTPKAPVGDGEGRAVAALREIEFDRATGKLSDADYEALRVKYTRDAITEMRAADLAAGRTATGKVAMEKTATDMTAVTTVVVARVSDEIVEAAIRRARELTKSCIDCGPPPETDATFCSNCGRFLDAACGKCGTPVLQADARFCVGCGEGLIAA